MTKKIFKSLSFHTMRYHLRPVRMFTIKKSSNNKCWRRCGKKGTILHCWWECNTGISTIQSSMCCAMLSHSVVSHSLEPMDRSPPGSSIHGGSPGKNTGVGFHALFQGILPNQGSIPGLPHCWWILYCLSHQENPESSI